VGINPILSDLQGPGTSKLDWRYLKHNKIDRNKLQIRTNTQKGTGTKMAENLNNFENFERKFLALFSTQRPPDDWPDALDHLSIGLDANKYTKLGKTSETLLHSQGMSYMKSPLWYFTNVLERCSMIFPVIHTFFD
jgi:hypothetical protein